MRNKLQTKRENELLELSLNEIIEALALDLESGSDRYRCLTPHVLASLLEVDAYQPDGTWSGVRFVPRLSVAELMDEKGSEPEFLVEFLEKRVNDERYKVLEKNFSFSNGKAFGSPGRDDKAIQAEFLAELKDEESAIIETEIQKKEFNDLSGGTSLCRYSVTSKGGYEIQFEGFVECDGSCIELSGPYDIRDDGLSDFTDCLTDYY